jgi:hypothetical protein
MGNQITTEHCRSDEERNELLREAWELWTEYLGPRPNMLYGQVADTNIWMISVDDKPVGYARDIESARTKMIEIGDSILWERGQDKSGIAYMQPGHNQLVVIGAAKFFFTKYFSLIANVRADEVLELA